MTCAAVAVLVGLAVALWPGRAEAPSGRAGAVASPSSLARVRTRWLASRRVVAQTDEVADALVLISLALRAGLPLTEALRHVHAAAVGRVRDDLAAVVAALRWGLAAEEAWAFAGPAWRAAATATHMSEQTGAAPAELIERAAARLREERERDREQAAARAGVLLVLPLGLGFLPAFACTAVVPVVLNLASGVLSGGR